MAEDLEVGVMLEVDESQLEDIEDRQVNATGGGAGDISPAQQDQQESVVAGGVSKGLLAAGVIAGILSQLKVITGIISAVLGAISRALVPIIEKVAEFVRPIVDLANRAAQGQKDAVNVVESVASGLIPSAVTGGALFPGFGTRTFDEPSDVGESVSNDPLLNFLGDALGGGKQNAELSDEADKQQTKNNVEDATKDKTGAFK